MLVFYFKVIKLTEQFSLFSKSVKVSSKPAADHFKRKYNFHSMVLLLYLFSNVIKMT